MLHALLHKMIQRLKDFGRLEGGMTLPMLAISMVAITGMVGMAIDTARMQLVQSKLQFSLDAAGLAAGSTVTTSALQTEVTKYLNANFNGYLGATLSGVGATVDSTNTIITLTATASLPTTFMSVVGVHTITVTAHSTISRALTGLELVMVLDNTGSMSNSAGGGNSKLQALQTASTTLINTLFASNPPAGKLWVGVVPFSQAVNIGTGHPTWMDTTYNNAILDTSGSSATTDWGPGGSWGGCVDARFTNSEDVIDDPPSTGSPNTLFRDYYWLSDSLNGDGVTNSNYNNWKQCTKRWNRCKNGNCSIVSGSCSTSNGFTCTVTTPTCTYSSPLNNTNAGPNLLCPQQVLPMTNVKTSLINSINSMTANGNTLINQGLFWGWNMISPRWQGQWGGTMDANGLPLAYNTQGMTKVIVLLTDGANTIDNTAHSAYWFLGDSKLGTTSSSTALTTLDNRTLQLCTAMKNKNIYIYTIALGTDTTASELAMLQSCATAPNYYFNSPSTTQLSTVFSQIGDSLANLRVSQ